MKGISFIRFIPGIAWFFVVLYLLCLPGDEIPEIRWLDFPGFDKLVHATLFGVMALLFTFPFFKLSLEALKQISFKICLSVCIWGLTTEFVQKFFIVRRTFDLADWLADTAGILLFYIVLNKWPRKFTYFSDKRNFPFKR